MLRLTLDGEAETVRSRDLSVSFRWLKQQTWRRPSPASHRDGIRSGDGECDRAMLLRLACWNSFWWTCSSWVDVNWSGINLTQNYLSNRDTGGSKPVQIGIASNNNRWDRSRSPALHWPDGLVSGVAVVARRNNSTGSLPWPKAYSLMLTINPK